MNKKVIYIILICIFILLCLYAFMAGFRDGKKIGQDDAEKTSNNSSNSQTTIMEEYAESQDTIYKEYKTQYDLQKVLNDSQVILSGDLDVSKLRLLSREEANKLYGTDEYEITVAQSTEGSFTEISSIKLKNTDDVTDVLSIITNRVQAIKDSHPEISSENQMAIEMNKGVLTFVAKEYGALKVSDVISSSLKSE